MSPYAGRRLADSMGMKDLRKWIPLGAAMLLTAGLPLAITAQTAKNDVKQAGHDTKQAAKDVGHASEKTAQKVTTTTKKGVNKAASGTEKAAGKVKRKTTTNPPPQ
jgi:hypothetical protein